MTLLATDPVGHHPRQRVPLVDLLDRVLAQGVVLTGDLTICIADVELIRLSLRLLLSSVRAGLREAAPYTAPTADPTAPRPAAGRPVPPGDGSPAADGGPPAVAPGRPVEEES